VHKVMAPTFQQSMYGCACDRLSFTSASASSSCIPCSKAAHGHQPLRIWQARRSLICVDPELSAFDVGYPHQTYAKHPKQCCSRRAIDAGW